MDRIEEAYMKELTDDMIFRNMFLFVRDKILNEAEDYSEKDL